MRADSEVRRVNFGCRSNNRIVRVCSYREAVAYEVEEDDGRLLIIWEDLKSGHPIASMECVRNGYAFWPSLIMLSSLILTKSKIRGDDTTSDVRLVRWIAG